MTWFQGRWSTEHVVLLCCVFNCRASWKLLEQVGLHEQWHSKVFTLVNYSIQERRLDTCVLVETVLHRLSWRTKRLRNATTKKHSYRVRLCGVQVVYNRIKPGIFILPPVSASSLQSTVDVWTWYTVNLAAFGSLLFNLFFDLTFVSFGTLLGC